MNLFLCLVVIVKSADADQRVYGKREEHGATVGLHIEPDAIHVMKKSEYSGRYGDYSTYSEEAEHLSDVEEEEVAAE